MSANINSVRYNGAVIRQTKSGSYQIDINARGLRYRQTAKSLPGARDLIDNIMVEIATEVEPITPHDADQYRRARAVLPSDVSVLDAAQYYVDMHARVSQTITLADAATEYVADLKALGRRPRTVKNARDRVGRFARTYPDLGCHECTADGIRDWLKRRALSATSRNNDIRALSAFFSWCISRGYAAANPCVDIARATEAAPDPEIFSVEHVQLFLTTLAEREPQMVPYYAVGFFTGVRSSELDQLTAGHIHSGAVHVTKDIAKMRQRRVIDIPENLTAWLAAYPMGARLAVTDQRRRYERILRRLRGGGFRWARNGMRHSFATYHYAAHRNADATAHALGHPNAGLLLSTYRNLATQAEGVKYFEVAP